MYTITVLTYFESKVYILNCDPEANVFQDCISRLSPIGICRTVRGGTQWRQVRSLKVMTSKGR